MGKVFAGLPFALWAAALCSMGCRVWVCPCPKFLLACPLGKGKGFPKGLQGLLKPPSACLCPKSKKKEAVGDVKDLKISFGYVCLLWVDSREGRRDAAPERAEALQPFSN